MRANFFNSFNFKFTLFLFLFFYSFLLSFSFLCLSLLIASPSLLSSFTNPQTLLSSSETHRWSAQAQPPQTRRHWPTFGCRLDPFRPLFSIFGVSVLCFELCLCFGLCLYFGFCVSSLLVFQICVSGWVFVSGMGFGFCFWLSLCFGLWFFCFLFFSSSLVVMGTAGLWLCSDFYGFNGDCGCVLVVEWNIILL